MSIGDIFERGNHELEGNDHADGPPTTKRKIRYGSEVEFTSSKDDKGDLGLTQLHLVTVFRS